MKWMLMCLIGLALSVSGCDVANALPIRAERESSTLSTTPQPAEVGDELEAQPATALQPTPEAEGPEATLALAEMEQRVKADLAAVLGASIDQIVVLEAADQVWADQGLGCNARKGMFEAVSVPGYRIVLAHEADTFEYHTDRQGRFVRCPEPGKPLDPISKPLYPIIRSER
jgi:hypothetical protein